VEEGINWDAGFLEVRNVHGENRAREDAHDDEGIAHRRTPNSENHSCPGCRGPADPPGAAEDRSSIVGLEDLVWDGEIGRSFIAFLSFIPPATRWPAFRGSLTSHHELAQVKFRKQVPLCPLPDGELAMFQQQLLRYT